MNKSVFTTAHIKMAFRHPLYISKILLIRFRRPALYKITLHPDCLIDPYCANLLYETVLKSKNKSPNIIEVGAFKGKSTCILSLAAARANKKVKSFELLVLFTCGV